MLVKYIYRNLSVYLQGNKIFLVGKLGCGFLEINGLGLFVYNSFLFFRSKQILKGFLAYLKQYGYGVIFGYYLELKFVGLGYRFFYLDEHLYLKLGYSHYIKITIPTNFELVGFKNRLVIFSLDLGALNLFAAEVRKLKVPDVYKGKGILVNNEKIKLKIGKKR